MSNDAQNIQNDDVIVLNKWMVIAAGVAVLIFVAGGLAGYFLAKYAFDHGVQQAVALQGDQQQPSIPQIQPTVPPSRISGVKTDGDPRIRTAAVQALGEIGTPKAKAALVEILNRKEN